MCLTAASRSLGRRSSELIPFSGKESGPVAKRNPNDPWRYAGLAGTIGLEMFGLIIGGVLGGRYLDDKFGTEPTWLGIGIIAGLILGIASAAYTLKTFIKD